MKHIEKYAFPTLLFLGFFVSYFCPSFFANNTFLVNFINHEYINLMTVIVTVSMVSVVQLHMEYTRIERKFKKRVFPNSRISVNKNAVILLSLLVLSFVISFGKGMIKDGSDQMIESFVHVFALATIFECIWVMYELIKTARIIAVNEPQ